jgi:uncharacterized repeat protein (TIGR01451 family)
MTMSSRRGLGPAGVYSRFLSRLFLLLLLPLLAWSGQAAATTVGCGIVDNSPGGPTQSGPAGSILSYSFTIVELQPGDCVGTISGTIANTFDNTGGASADIPTFSGIAGDTFNVSITLGPNGGGTSTFLVDCDTGCYNIPTQVTWTANTNDVFSLTADPPTSVTIMQNGRMSQFGPPDSVATLNAHYFRNGTDNNDSTIWSPSPAGGALTVTNPVFTDDISGLVTNNFYADSPGTYDLAVDGNPSECGSLCPPTIHYTVTVEDPSFSYVAPASGSATVLQNGSIDLKVKYAGPTLPVLDGTPVAYEVVSQPAAGASNFTAQDYATHKQVTTTGGIAQATLNVTIPGTYQVQVCWETDGCLSGDDKILIDITVNAQSADVGITKSDSPSPVVVGEQLTYTITASNAGADPSDNVQWTDTLPAGLNFESISTISGWTCTTPAVGTNGTIDCSNPTVAAGANDIFTVVTTVDPSFSGSTISNSATISSTGTFDPNTSNNNATTTTPITAASPSLTIAKVLSGTVDNDSSSSVTAGDQLDYTVTVKNNGNSTLHNVVVSDDHFVATQTCATLAVNATCVLSGSYIVTGADALAGSVDNTGSVTSTEVAGPTTDTVNTPIAAAADVSISKTDSPDPVAPGAQLTHTITVGNAGTTASTVGWTDTLPNSLNFVSMTTPAGWSCSVPSVGSTGTITCNAASLADGASDVFTLVTDVAFSAAGSSISNTANVTSATFDPSSANNTSTSTTAVNAAAPALSIAKVLSGSVDNDGSSSVTAGDQLDYTVTATNTGNVPLSNVVVSDDHFAATQSCPSLAISATCVLTGSYVVTGADVTTGSVTNVGSVTSSEVPGPTTASVNTPVNVAADVSISKTDAPDPVAPGANLTYTITVGNAGSTASTVAWNDVLPASLRFISLSAPAGWSCSVPAVGSSGTVTCSVASLANAANDVFTLVTAVAFSAAGSTQTNTATVSSATFDPNSANNSATSTTAVSAGAPSLAIAKVLSSTTDNDGSGSVTAGDQLNYTVTVTNNGNVPLGNVVVSDDHFPATQTCAVLATSATCVLTGSYTVTGADAIAGSVTNVGSVTSNEVPGPTTSSVVTPIAASANLAITKTDSPDPVLGGQSITYTIGVSNAGPQAAVSVAMSDVLAPQLGFVSLAAPAGWACGTPAVGASGAVNCTLANLPNGGSGTFTLVAKVAAGAGGSSVSNTATVSAATFDPSNADNSATATTAVTAVAPSMQVVKVLSGTVDNDSSGSVTTGDQLDYTVTATNNGNVPLSNVVVSDDHFAATQSCPTLAVNATCVLTGSYIVTAGDATAGTVTNVGSATSTQAAGPFTSSVTTPVGASTPSLAVVKVLSGTVDNVSEEHETELQTLLQNV